MSKSVMRPKHEFDKTFSTLGTNTKTGMLDFKRQSERNQDLFRDEKVPESIMLGGQYDVSRGSKSTTLSVPKMNRGAKRNIMFEDVKGSPFQSIDQCELDSSLYNSSMAIPKK